MTKSELTEILNSLEISINEGIQNDKDSNIFPRIVFWEFVWEPVSASGSIYETIVSYQISFFSNIPRNPKLIGLLKLLESHNIKPIVQHEYIEEKRYFHSYFSVEVLENIE